MKIKTIYRYQIYHPSQNPPTDGAEVIFDNPEIDKETFTILQSGIIRKAKKTARKFKWKYSDMIHKHNLIVL